MTSGNHKLLMQVATMYYAQQLTQSEIGRQLKTSRSTVSRLLQEARDKGIVKITIEYPWERDKALEDTLQQTFGLHDVRVLTTYNQSLEEIRNGRGLMAAEYLNQIVHDDMIITVSYGRSIASMVSQLQPTHPVNMSVVQMIGSLGTDNPLLDGPDLVRDLAQAYGAQHRYLHAPLLVEDYRTRDLLLQESSVQETLSLAKRANVAILGVGALESNSSGLIWTGYLNPKDIIWLQNKGGVGHMCAQHFDINGQLLDVDFNRRAIGIGIEALRGIDLVMAIAGSEEKAKAILGAIRGNYIDILITDDQAAQRILELNAATNTTGNLNRDGAPSRQTEFTKQAA